MAKIKYSALVQEMRNKLNGSVMSKNRYGNYVRNKTTPTNPNTEYQQRQRSRLSSVSQAWAGLNVFARKGFSDLAEQHPYSNIFGDMVKLDGKAMFSKLSLNLLSAGKAMLATPVPFVAVPFIALSAVDYDDVDSTLELTFSKTTVPVGYTLVIQATPPLPATINFVKNQFREIGTAVLTAGKVDITDMYSARFPQFDGTPATSKFHVLAFLVNNTTGQNSIATTGVS